MKKKMLIVGELGYHEKNITNHIIKNIKKNYKIDRLGGNFDFFIPSNYDKIVDNYFNAIPKSLKDYDMVFFVDYWNMIMPIFMYKKSIENPDCKFVALYHGSVLFENDVANEIINSENYENYLLSSYDYIFVNYEWIKEMHNYPSNMIVAKYPLDEQLNREKPNLNYAKNLYFIHRFHEDKGVKKFIEFLDYCNEYDYLKELNVYVFDEKPDWFNNTNYNLNFLGRKTQKEIKKFVSKGGYAWSSVKSETIGYGILDLISYGVTPILNLQPSYKIYPDKFIYKNFENVIDKIFKKKIKFTQKDWKNLKKWYNKELKIYDFFNQIG